MSYLVLSCLGRNSSPIKARGAYNGALLLVGAGSRERPALSNVVSVPVSGLTVCRSFLFLVGVQVVRHDMMHRKRDGMWPLL